MKISPVMLAVSAGIAALAAYVFYAGNSGEAYRWLITFGSGISVLLTIGGLLAISSEGGVAVNIKAASALFFALLLVEHLVFSFASVKPAPYVVITGILLLVYVTVAYAVTKALK
jgi:hypothetical protein